MGNEDDKKEFNDDENVSMTRLLAHIAFGGASRLKDVTATTASEITSFVPDFLHVSKIDKMVDTATVAAYALVAFGVTGTLYYSLRTVREFGQWRQWYKYRNLFKKSQMKLPK